MSTLLAFMLSSSISHAADQVLVYPFSSNRDGDIYNDFDGHASYCPSCQGIDYDVAHGTPIYASVAGTVTVVDGKSDQGDAPGCDDTAGYGNYVKISSGSVRVLTGHMAKGTIAVTNGQTVSAGQLLGYSSNSGYTCGSDVNGSAYHVHYEIEVYNSTTSSWTDVDPYTGYFIKDSDGSYRYPSETDTCDSTVTWDMSLVVADPDSSSSDQYDFHSWYRMNVGSGSDDYDETNGHLYLLDHSDLGSKYVDPVINNEGYKSNHEQWLKGNLNDDAWDDIILIAHNNGDMKAQVWLSNGDGTFQSKDKWLETSTQYDLYMHGERGKLIAGIWDDGLQWYNCNVNDDNDGYKSCSHWGQLGGDIDEDVYLTGDFNGDNKADILRGYVTSGADTCPIDSGQKVLKWRILRGGELSSEGWFSDWGCEKSKYVVGDFNGDGKDDIAQLRFDDSSTGRMIVALSRCSDDSTDCHVDADHKFVGDGTWKGDFGDKNYQYFVHDMNGDGYDDVIHYKDNSKDHIHVAYSTGSYFGYVDYHKGGVDMDSGGAFLFGDFGELTLDEDEEEVCE